MQPKRDTIQEGEFFLMGQGQKFDENYISGLYQAVHDLDFGELQAEFSAQGPDVYLSHERDITTLLGDAGGHDRCEMNFQLWLMDNNHVKQVPCKAALIFARQLILRNGRFDGVEIECSISDPIKDNAPIVMSIDSEQQNYEP